MKLFEDRTARWYVEATETGVAVFVATYGGYPVPLNTEEAVHLAGAIRRAVGALEAER